MQRADKEQREKRLIRLLYTGSLVLLLLVFWATLRGFAGFKETIAQRKDITMARTEAQALLSSLKDSETGCRGFLLTHDTSYLQPYHLAVQEVPQRLYKLDGMLTDTLNRTRIASLRDLTTKVFLLNRELVLHGLSPTTEAPIALSMRLDRGKVLMNQIRAVVNDIDSDLAATSSTYAAEERSGGWHTPLMLVCYTAVAIVATALLFGRLFRALTRAEEAEGEVRHKVAELDQEVRTREFAERTLRRVLDSSPSAIMAFRSIRDEGGNIADLEFLLANEEAERMTGMVHGDLVGKRLLEVMPESMTNGAFREYVKVVDTGVPHMSERRTGSHGTNQWLSVHVVRLLDGLVVTFTDISERMQAEGLALEADRLALADRISRTVAHEVRNPLTNVHLALEQMNDELKADKEAAQPFVDIVQRNIRRIGQLVTEMLESSRKRELNPIPFPVADLVDQAMKRVADRLALRNMRGEVDLQKDLPNVLVDPGLINLAITNIAVNAIEAMEPGKGVLRIKASSTEDGVSIEIRDNGKGIPPEKIGRLFEAFYTERAGGMGLGLTTARSILSSHGILLEVGSSVGEGTTFTLNFPEALIARTASALQDERR